MKSQQSYLQNYHKALSWINRYSIPGGGISVTSAERIIYPEVTGYYIPTLLNWGHHEEALRFGKALLPLQNAEGSWNDPYGKEPYVFDTGQILRGLFALSETHPEFVQPLLRGCDWIKSLQLPSGQIPTPNPAMWSGTPEAVHLYAVSPLLAVAERFNRPDLKATAEKALAYYVNEEKDFKFRCLSHFHAYMIDGLIELGREDLARNAMNKIASLQRYNGSVPGFSGLSGTCSTGLFQYAIIWYKLGEMEKADRAFDYACSLQNASGGWFGSYGKCKKYFTNAEIAWAVKYFLDAFHLKLRSNFNAIFDSFIPAIDENDGRFQLVRKHIPAAKGAKILDCGCGKGRYVNRLAKEFPDSDFHAVDLSPIAHQFLDAGITKGTGSVLRTDFPDDSFDFVYSSEVVEHAVDLDSAVKELVRITKPEGTILIIDKNIDCLGKLKLCPWEQWFDAEKFSRLWNDHGCEVEIVRNISYEKKNGTDGIFLGWIARNKKHQPKPPVISIVLPVHNGAKYLRESIESCLEQTFKHWELIIVNDCSTDESGAIAEEYAAQDSRIKVIHNETNLKLPGSLNAGFRQAAGEYLTWTSDDNRYLPQALQTMLDYLRDHPEHKMVCAAYEEIDVEGNFTKRAFSPLWRPLLRLNTIGACFLYHRSILETIGEYNTNCFLAEDYEYWLRIMRRYSIGVIQEIQYCYRIHPQSLTNAHQQEIQRKVVEIQLTFWKELNQTLTGRHRRRVIKKMIKVLDLHNDLAALKTFAAQNCFANTLDQKVFSRYMLLNKLRHVGNNCVRYLSINFGKK